MDSSDVNGYLHEVSGENFSAKDFRTWAGTVLTAVCLADIGTFRSETEARRNIVEAIKRTAARLGNRPATCRNYYVHPAIPDAYREGSLVDVIRKAAAGRPSGALHPEEQCVVDLIKLTGSPAGRLHAA